MTWGLLQEVRVATFANGLLRLSNESSLKKLRMRKLGLKSSGFHPGEGKGLSVLWGSYSDSESGFTHLAYTHGFWLDFGLMLELKLGRVWGG